MGSASRALVVLSSSYFIMVLASLLFFLPALALSSKDSVAIVPAEDLKVCEYFDARIVRLREIVNKELGPDVDIGSDLYTTLEESKLCDTVGYIAIPECVANNGGDECVARKTSESIRKTLRAAMKAEKIKQLPSGEKFFATCKHIGYKNVLKTFKSARTLMSPECGLPGLGGGRSRRSLDLLPALLLGGSYDLALSGSSTSFARISTCIVTSSHRGGPKDNMGSTICTTTYLMTPLVFSQGLLTVTLLLLHCLVD